MNYRKNILIIAYACNPEKGSEAYIGWNWTNIISKKNNVILITSDGKDKRQAIEKQLLNRNKDLPSLRIYYIKRLFDYDWTKHSLLGRIFNWILYLIWHLKVYFVAKKIIKKNGIDVIHHITYNSIFFPNPILTFKKLTVWGPVGGGEVVPDSLKIYLSKKAKIYENLRKILMVLSFYNPLLKKVLSKVKIVLVSNSSTMDYLYKFNKNLCVIKCPEIAIDEKIVENKIKQINYKPDDKIILLYVGVLLPIKGLRFLFDVLKFMGKVQNWKLIIVGKGEEEKYLKNLSVELNLQDKIEFVGWVNKNNIFTYYQIADIFVFPSLRDTTGNVLLEAMIHKLPIVCLNWSGPGEIVNEKCGFKIPIKGYEQIKADFLDALIKLINNNSLRNLMGEQGYEYVLNNYTWKVKEKIIENIYQTLFNNTA